jgi:hypothetical protein
MTRDQEPASVHLRMSPQLRESLRDAANDSGRNGSRVARDDFINAMRLEMGSVAMVALVQRLDVEDPGHFLEWQNARQTVA